MIQIKARFAGNGHPLPRAATQSWGILDVPNSLKYKDRPKHALAWTALSKLVVDELQRRLDALPRKRTLRLCVA
jgi:hypothetical protein